MGKALMGSVGENRQHQEQQFFVLAVAHALVEVTNWCFVCSRINVIVYLAFVYSPLWSSRPLWALKKMSWNCKNLGMKGSLSSNFRLRKLLSGGWRWRRKYLILWLMFVAIGLIGLLISLNNGLMRRKVDAPDLDEDNTNLLLEHFNVSKERIQVLSAENVVYQKQYELAIEKLEANGQCPVPDENTLTNLDIVVQQIPLPISHCASLATSSDHQFCEKEPLQGRALGDQCKDAAFYFTKVLSILHWDFFDHACDSESFRFAVDNDSYTPGAKSNSYHGLGKSSAAKNMVGKAGLQQSESKGDNIFKSNQTFSLLRLDPIRTPFSAGGELTAVVSAKNLTKILPENFQKDFNLAKANSKQLDEEIADKKERAIHESLVIMKRVSF
nr:histidine kinase 2 [Ipomoea batatas]